MRRNHHSGIDLMPPGFAEGLDDWSRGHGTPDSPTYERADYVRVAVDDPEFGPCLEMRKVEPVQRLRYMGEMPVPSGAFIEISARIKALRGPIPSVRVAAWPGGPHGRAVRDLPTAGPLLPIGCQDLVHTVRAVIGPEALPGVDLVWDGRAVYAHVGLDLLGPIGGVLRIENLAVRDVRERFEVAGGTATARHEVRPRH